MVTPPPGNSSNRWQYKDQVGLRLLSTVVTGGDRSIRWYLHLLATTVTGRGRRIRWYLHLLATLVTKRG